MEMVYLLLPLALVIVVVAVIAFIWAVRNGQMDDLETPAYRALHDPVPDPEPRPQSEELDDDESDPISRHSPT